MLDSRFKLRHLQALVAVSRLRSVQASAHALSRTPSAVSKSVTELEAILGARLFERTRRGLLPTPAAERLLRQVHRGLAILGDAMDEAAGGEAAHGTPTVTIGVLFAGRRGGAALSGAARQRRRARRGGHEHRLAGAAAGGPA
jgi:LysR family pca operon transcriptional activator